MTAVMNNWFWIANCQQITLQMQNLILKYRKFQNSPTWSGGHFKEKLLTMLSMFVCGYYILIIHKEVTATYLFVSPSITQCVSRARIECVLDKQWQYCNIFRYPDSQPSISEFFIILTRIYWIFNYWYVSYNEEIKKIIIKYKYNASNKRLVFDLWPEFGSDYHLKFNCD